MPEVLGVPLSTALIVLALVAVQTAGGGLIWLAARRGPCSWTEFLGMGFALGTVLATLGSQVSISLGTGAWGWLLAPLAGGVAWMWHHKATGDRFRFLPISRRGAAVLLPALVIGALALVPSVVLTPLKFGYVVGGEYQPDTIFQEALAQSVATWGPSDSSMLVGQPIRYHWLAYGWIGNLTDLSGAGPFEVMTRLFPIVILIAAVLLAAAWARVLSPIWWVPGLAAALVAVGGYVGALQGVVLTYDSPSTAYAAVLALAFALVMTLWLREQTRAWCLALLGLLAFSLVGAKASQAAVIAAGVAAVALWGVIARRWKLIAPFVAASALGMALGYVVFLQGVAGDETNIGVSGTQEYASTFQGLDPFPGSLGIVLGTIALLLAIAPRWIGTFWLAGNRALRAETYFGAGLVVAAVGTLAVLRSGTNAAWFALASTALISVLAAVGVGNALTKVDYRWGGVRAVEDPVLWALVAAAIVNLAVLFAFALAAVSGAPVLWRGPVIAWFLAALAAVALARFRSLDGRWWLRWAAMLTVVITLTSVGARINGSLVWGAAHSRLTPAVQDFIRVFDPAAEFSATVEVDAQHRVMNGVKSATASVPSEDMRGADDGVARRASIIQWTPGMNDAALTLRELSDETSVVAVSRPMLQPFLPIISQRRALLAGLPYSAGYTTTRGVAAVDTRVEEMDSFLAEPTDARASQLVESGVEWLWITPESFDALTRITPWTEVVVSDPDVVLLRLSAEGANS